MSSFLKSTVIKVVSGYNLALSMSWHPLSDKKDKKQLKELCRKNSQRAGVIVESKNSTSVDTSLSVGFITDSAPNRKKTVSAAALARYIDLDCFCLVLPVDEERYWVCAIIDGVAIRESDVVVEKPLANLYVKEFREIFAANMVGDEAFFDEYFESYGAEKTKQYTALTFTELVEKGRGGAAEIKPLVLDEKKIKTAGIYFASAVLLAALFGKGVVSYVQNNYFGYEEQRKKIEWINRNELEREKIVAEFNRVAATHPIRSWITNLKETLDLLPIEARGWHLSEFNCKSERDHCDAVWSKRSVGTFQSLRSAVGHISDVTFRDGVAYQSVPIVSPIKRSFSLPEVFDLIQKMPDKRAVEEKHLSQLQRLGILPGVRYGLKPATQIGQYQEPPLDIAGLDISDELNKKFGGFSYAKWALEGKGLGLLIGSLQMLDPNVFFGRDLKLKIKYSATEISVNWSIEGYYVEKK